MEAHIYAGSQNGRAGGGPSLPVCRRRVSLSRDTGTWLVRRVTNAAALCRQQLAAVPRCLLRLGAPAGRPLGLACDSAAYRASLRDCGGGGRGGGRSVMPARRAAMWRALAVLCPPCGVLPPRPPAEGGGGGGGRGRSCTTHVPGSRDDVMDMR